MARDLKERATAAPAQRSNAPATLAQQIDRMGPEFQRAMPKGLEATQLVRDAQTALRQTRDLAKCEAATVLGGLMTCAQLGLRPGVLGQAYLLPFWDSKARTHKAQLVIGYQGLLELIYRSGMVETVAARIVYENDEFLLEYGLAEDKLVHRPPAGGGARGAAVAYYAIARMKGGGYAMTDPMGVEDMRAYARKHATAKKRDGTLVGPWAQNFDEMAKKTCVRQLAKMLPKSPEVSRAITHDGAVRADATPAAVDAQPDYIDGEFSEAPGVDDDPQADNNPVDNPPADDEPGEPDPTPQQRVAEYLQGAGITDPDNVAGWLQQMVGDPDAPANPADLTADEAVKVLDAIAESN
ncbi:RecT-like DNA pairing protein [Gordonia phage Twonlo]|uniref:RecT-like DNA pairing protein n=2 Tax=Dexdertvirus TaxID=2948679 RepID=A0A411CSF9_9CAUD|nr:RecT-like ssDNA annealing protein [Gordonia phage Tiamoceli]QAY16792.1 RecT-like DNA pairing protein [Gordonia phage Tiamoceli]QDF19630.1 RecT-like DNA pairing protein [Gordonia Terrae phage RoadKill]QOI66791.1 RecT-like DNA pairing protein [Gordonia phage Twonlo]WNO27349.1 RecT-like DNA pairing protein [Gordonia phage Kwekel]